MSEQKLYAPPLDVHRGLCASCNQWFELKGWPYSASPKIPTHRHANTALAARRCDCPGSGCMPSEMRLAGQ